MIENTETGALESFNFEQLQKHVPELQRFAFRIDTYQFDPPMDSSDMDPDAWRKLVRIISDNYGRYTGFVILHGTDTMAYTASALRRCRIADIQIQHEGTKKHKAFAQTTIHKKLHKKRRQRVEKSYLWPIILEGMLNYG